MSLAKADETERGEIQWVVVIKVLRWSCTLQVTATDAPPEICVSKRKFGDGGSGEWGGGGDMVGLSLANIDEAEGACKRLR